MRERKENQSKSGRQDGRSYGRSMGGLTGGVRGGLETYNPLRIRRLTKIRGGLRENYKIHVLQKICKHYLDFHLDG